MRSTPPLRGFPQCCLCNGSSVRLTDDGPLWSFQGRSSGASSFHASLLQAIDGVTSLDLGPQAVSQAPQHFRSSEEQATCDSCFARQCIRSVISFHSGMSRAVQPQDFSKVGVDHRHIPVWAFGSTFDIIIITVKVFTKHEILSLETIQSARMHARRHTRTHAHTTFGPYVWNSLPQDLRHFSTQSSFKAKLRTFRFSQYLRPN